MGFLSLKYYRYNIKLCFGSCFRNHCCFMQVVNLLLFSFCCFWYYLYKMYDLSDRIRVERRLNLWCMHSHWMHSMLLCFWSCYSYLNMLDVCSRMENVHYPCFWICSRLTVLWKMRLELLVLSNYSFSMHCLRYRILPQRRSLPED